MLDSILSKGQSYKINVKKTQKKLKILDTIAAALGLFGLAIATIEFEFYYQQTEIIVPIPGKDAENHDIIIDQQKTSAEAETPGLSGMRILVSVSTLILLFIIIWRYKLAYQLELIYRNYTRRYTFHNKSNEAPEKKLRRKMFITMLIEIILLAIHSPPFANFKFVELEQQNRLEYSSDNIVVILMQCRIYLLIRIMRYYSKWDNDTAKAICKQQHSETGSNFVIKVALKLYPYTSLVFFMGTAIFIFGFIIRESERPYMYVSGLHWDQLWNGFWDIIIIMTTVGYGDFYPRTHFGRFIGVFACFTGQFFISLMIMAMSNTSQFTNDEFRAYRRFKKREDRRKLAITAINTIKYAIKYWMVLKRNPLSSHVTHSYLLQKFMNNLIKFKFDRKSILQNAMNRPLSSLYYKANKKICKETDEVIGLFRKIGTIIPKISRIEEKSKLLIDRSDELLNLNKNLHDALVEIKAKTTIHDDFDNILQNLGSLDVLNVIAQERTKQSSAIPIPSNLQKRFDPEELKNLQKPELKKKVKTLQAGIKSDSSETSSSDTDTDNNSSSNSSDNGSNRSSEITKQDSLINKQKENIDNDCNLNKSQDFKEEKEISNLKLDRPILQADNEPYNSTSFSTSEDSRKRSSLLSNLNNLHAEIMNTNGTPNRLSNNSSSIDSLNKSSNMILIVPETKKILSKNGYNKFGVSNTSRITDKRRFQNDSQFPSNIIIEEHSESNTLETPQNAEQIKRFTQSNNEKPENSSFASNINKQDSQGFSQDNKNIQGINATILDDIVQDKRTKSEDIIDKNILANNHKSMISSKKQKLDSNTATNNQNTIAKAILDNTYGSTLDLLNEPKKEHFNTHNYYNKEPNIDLNSVIKNTEISLNAPEILENLNPKSFSIDEIQKQTNNYSIISDNDALTKSSKRNNQNTSNTSHVKAINSEEDSLTAFVAKNQQQISQEI